MRKILFSSLALGGLILALAFTPASKLISQKTHVQFFSSTPAEDIEAHNYKSLSTLDTETGAFVFSVPMQSFEFDKRLMQKHFNQEKFLNTKAFPKAKMTGRLKNIAQIDFQKDGAYPAIITGEMTIHGVSQQFEAEGEFKVQANHIQLHAEFPITLADYGVAFEKGKPAKNIAQTVKVTVESEYSKN